MLAAAASLSTKKVWLDGGPGTHLLSPVSGLIVFTPAQFVQAAKDGTPEEEQAAQELFDIARMLGSDSKEFERIKNQQYKVLWDDPSEHPRRPAKVDCWQFQERRPGIEVFLIFLLVELVQFSCAPRAFKFLGAVVIELLRAKMFP